MSYKITKIVVLLFVFIFFAQAKGNTLNFSKSDIQREQFVTRGGAYFFSKQQLKNVLEKLSYIKNKTEIEITIPRNLLVAIPQTGKFYKQAYIYKMRNELKRQRSGNRLTILVENRIITQNQQVDNRYGYTLDQIEQFAAEIVSIKNRGNHKLVVYRAYEHSDINLIYAAIPYFEGYKII